MEVERAAFPTTEEATIVEQVRDQPGYFEPAFTLRRFADPFAGARHEGFEIAKADFQVAVLDEPRVRSMSGEVRWHPAFG
jgi:hypothetical protein